MAEETARRETTGSETGHGARLLGRVLAPTAAAVILLAAVALAHGHHASTLGKVKHYPVTGPDQLRQVAVGDVNGDGRKDIVVSDNFNPKAYPLLGTKHGFKAETGIPIGNVSHGLVLGDVNHDGRSDFVSGGVPLTVTSSAGGHHIVNSFDFDAQAVAIADVNRDHNPDVLAGANFGDEIAVILAKHKGVSGQMVHTYPTAAQPVGLAAGNLNADNDPDLAVVENVPDLGAAVQVFKGDGDGGFTPANSSLILANADADGMVGGNFNGDRHLDVAVTQGCTISEPPRVLVALGKNGGFKNPSSTKSPSGICGEEPAAGDVNGDGRLDLLAAENGGSHGGGIDVFRGKGNGHLRKPQQFPAVDSAQAVAVGNLNGDRRLDAVVPDTGPTIRVGVLFGKRR